MAEVEGAESSVDGRLIEHEMVGSNVTVVRHLYTYPERARRCKTHAFPTSFKVQFDEKETSRTRETLVFNEMCVERGRKLRDPFKFNVTTKLENV